MSIHNVKLCHTFVLIACGIVFPAYGQQTLEESLAEAPPIYRVEEDWELLIANPDPELDIPQIVNVFGPTNVYFDTHTVFELNHGTLPSFGQGGMQLQVWYGDYLVGYQHQLAPTELNVANETIRYTTVTSIKGDYLEMEVTNGTSATFGAFGGAGTIKARLYTFRNDLNPYQPNNSINNSRVTFGANRVTHFKRSAIRFYQADGTLYVEDTHEKFVHKLN